MSKCFKTSKFRKSVPVFLHTGRIDYMCQIL